MMVALYSVILYLMFKTMPPATSTYSSFSAMTRRLKQMYNGPATPCYKNRKS